MAQDARVLRRDEVQDPALAGERYDYADCFEVRAVAVREHTPESLARVALEGTPRAIRFLILAAHRCVLRFRLGPPTSEDHVLGWRIVTSTPDLVVLEADGPLVRGVMVGRKTGPDVALLRTFVFFRTPSAPFVWRIVGVLHRAIAPYLLRRAAATR